MFGIFFARYLYILFLGVSLGGLIGGFFYEKLGGVSTFKIFSTGSLLMGILHILFIEFSRTNVNGFP